MSRKILAIVGSPRRNGNTHILVSRIADGAKAKGAAADLIFLSDLAIAECDGCHACWKGRDCSKKDDMLSLYPKIIAADAIILGTPVYWYGPTALMKAFIDRFVYFNCPANREKIRGKSAAIAVPFEEDDPEIAGGVVEFFEKSLEYLQMVLLGKIIVPGVSEKGDVHRKPEYLQQAYELGQTLAGS